MIQAIIKKGKVLGEEVPAPIVSKRGVLIKVVNSCISVGTEMVGFNNSRKSIIKLAMEQPENVKKVINMAKSESIAGVYQRVKSKISGGRPTGYSISGVVIGVGEEVINFKAGDKVAAGGADAAYHAEYVDVPNNLVVAMPEGLDFASASTVTIGAIAMHGVRRAGLNIGEFAAVTGVGVIGLLTVQMLTRSGVRVAAVDLDEERLKIAKKVGAEICVNPSVEDPVQEILNWSNGAGVDAAIFTAATGSSQPLSQSFQMCRRKGRAVLVGSSGMEIKREDLYLKELEILMSTSYGPGRYDKNYENKGLDYPYAYVRWTENRNMSEYLRLVTCGAINLETLSLKKYSIKQVTDAFNSFQTLENKPLTVILDYGEPELDKLNDYLQHGRKVNLNTSLIKKDVINVALVGTGNFAVGTHLPNLAKLSDKFNLYAVVNRSGYKGKVIAEQYNAKYVTTNYEDILCDRNVDLVMVTTRHDSHAELALKALKAGKNVFVEKPLAVNKEQLNAIYSFFDQHNTYPLLMVGFNRRFSRYANEIKKHTKNRTNPLFIFYRMNAGFISLENWAHEDGGRIVGEACHIIDLMTFFTESRIKSINYEEITPKSEQFSSADNKSFTLKYDDGSLATICYFSIGNKKFAKEYMEIHYDQKTIILDDYKSLKGYGIKIDEICTKKSKKGQFEELDRLYKTLKSEDSTWPIDLWDILQTTETSLILASR